MPQRWDGRCRLLLGFSMGCPCEGAASPPHNLHPLANPPPLSKLPSHPSHGGPRGSKPPPPTRVPDPKRVTLSAYPQPCPVPPPETRLQLQPTYSPQQNPPNPRADPPTPVTTTLPPYSFSSFLLVIHPHPPLLQPLHRSRCPPMPIYPLPIFRPPAKHSSWHVPELLNLVKSREDGELIT